MPEVQRVNTPLVDEQAAVELEIALKTHGVELHRDMAALLLAQIGFETGFTHCDNNNPGNISSSDHTGRTFFRPAWFTVDDSSSVKLHQLHDAMLRGEAPRAFVAYNTLADGFDDYARELVQQSPEILTAARTGDARATADAIKRSHYTPDAPRTLPQTLDSLRKQFLARGFFADLPLDPAPAALPTPGQSSS
jgi:hypothetical protein